jgi:hypothetical protein
MLGHEGMRFFQKRRPRPVIPPLLMAQSVSNCVTERLIAHSFKGFVRAAIADGKDPGTVPADLPSESRRGPFGKVMEERCAAAAFQVDPGKAAITQSQVALRLAAVDYVYTAGNQDGRLILDMQFNLAAGDDKQQQRIILIAGNLIRRLTVIITPERAVNQRLQCHRRWIENVNFRIRQDTSFIRNQNYIPSSPASRPDQLASLVLFRVLL